MFRFIDAQGFRKMHSPEMTCRAALAKPVFWPMNDLMAFSRDGLDYESKVQKVYKPLTIKFQACGVMEVCQ